LFVTLKKGKRGNTSAAYIAKKWKTKKARIEGGVLEGNPLLEGKVEFGRGIGGRGRGMK